MENYLFSFNFFYLLIAATLFSVLFYLYFKSKRLVKEANFFKIFLTYDLSKRNCALDRNMFQALNNLKLGNTEISKKLEIYFKSFSLNYLDLQITFELIKEVHSRKKQKLLKNILQNAISTLAENDLALLYVSGLEKEYSPFYPPEFYKEKKDLILYCLTNKNKKIFFEATYQLITKMTESADKSINERVLLFSEKVQLCNEFAN